MTTEKLGEIIIEREGRNVDSSRPHKDSKEKKIILHSNRKMLQLDFFNIYFTRYCPRLLIARKAADQSLKYK